MSITTWLFLYLAGLVELTIRYRLSFSAGLSAFVVLIPLLALAVPRPQWPRLHVVGAVLAMGCAILFARSLSLGFWDTQRMDLALLSAGIGVGGLLAVREESSRTEWHIANWLLVSAGWLLALWHPIGPMLAIAPAASLAVWHRAEPAMKEVPGLSPAWLLFWIGMALPKPWWDSDSLGAIGTALWALGVASTYVPKMRDLRPPLPLLAVIVIPLVYAWLPLWIWAPLLGLLSGFALQQAARPWPPAAAYALVGGLLLSYGLHSNLQLFGLLVWGSR